MNAFLDRAQSIFFAAIEKHAPGEWPVFLDDACGGEAELRRYVEQLLESHVALGSIHAEASPPSNDTLDQSVQHVGALIGPFKLLEQIGEGGMGTVFVAQQSEPLKRLVALKIIKPGMDSRQVIARFEAERQALALMDHPNIAKVLDAGTTDAGRPYFVMELVKGVPITQYCDQHHLTPRQRLELFVPVCQAIQHAHQKGIIHRDLKPSNVLVALYDDQPVPKVIDFGVAKATGQQLTEQTLHTGFGAVVGTLEYMSPEQATFNQLDVDTRSDIYSLGVLLYELLAGSPPFSRQNLEQAGLLEMLRLIREQEPSKPSTKLSSSDALPTLSANRGTEPARLTKLLRGELDWIVMKALDKDRARRYETANGLVMDIQRYLADEPVQACPPSLGYRLRKFVKRNKAALTAASVVALAVFVAVGGLGWMVRDRSMRQAETAQGVSESLTRARNWIGEKNLPSARRELAEARGRLGSDSIALRDVTRELEDLEAEVETRVQAQERFRHFVEYIDQAHERETSRGAAVTGKAKTYEYRDPGEAIPLILRTMDLYGVIERDDWSARLEKDWLESDQVTQIRRAVYEKLLWLAEDLRHRQVEHLTGADLDGPTSARRAMAYLKKAEAMAPPTRALFWIRGRCWEQIGDQQAAKADSQRVRESQTLTATDHFLVGQAAYFAAEGPALAEKKAEGIREFEAALRLDPSHYWSLMWLGWCLCDRGEGQERAEAVRVFTGCIALRPRHAHAYYCRAIALSFLGQPDQALADFDAALALKPDHELALRERGKAFMTLRRYDRVRSDLTLAVNLEPRDDEAWANLGITHEQLGDLDKAASAFAKSAELDPSAAEIHQRLGNVYYKRGKWDEAIASCRKAIELDKNRVSAHNILGLAYYHQNLWDEAIACFRKAIELDPKYASAHSNLGNCLYEQGKWDEAIACHREATKLAPSYSSPHNNLANVFMKQGKVDEAIAAFRRTIELDPKNVNAYHCLGVLLCDHKHDHAGAIAAFGEAIKLEPKFATAHSNLGNALSNQGKFDEAIAAHRRAIELDPRMVSAHYGVGFCYSKKGEWDEAIVWYRKAIALDPKYADAYTGLGTALGKLDKLDEAIVYYQKGIELNPQDILAHFNLGQNLAKQSNWEEAIACFQKAIALDARFANAHDSLGRVYDIQEKHGEAIACYRKAIEINSEDPSFHCSLGNSLSKQAKWDEAIASFRKASQLVARAEDDAHGFVAGSLNNAAWQLATNSDPKIRNAAVAVELAGESVRLNPVGGHWNTLGVAHYRAGDSKAAVAALEQSMTLRDGGDSSDWFFLAMADWQLGDKAEARRWYEKAIAWINEKKSKDEELLRFCAEASAMLGVAVKGGVESAPPPRELKK